KAAGASDYARAIGLLKKVVEDGGQRPIQGKARALLGDLEQQAAAKIARARQLVDRGQSTEAVDAGNELVRVYPGTLAAREGDRMLAMLTGSSEMKAQQRAARARELLAQAREEYRSQQYLACLNHCDALQAGYADLPEGTEAGQLATE